MKTSHSLKLWDAIMIVAGSMIGSGIFIVSSDMAKDVGSAAWLLLAWVVSGIMTVIAATSYGEFSAMFPKAGGQYIYLKQAYNPKIAFLYGWSFFSIIQTGTIAAVGVAFSKFAGYFFPVLNMAPEHALLSIGNFHIFPAQLLAIALILFLTYSNTQGIKGGKLIQNIFTSTKLLALFGLIIAGFVCFNPNVWNQNWSGSFQPYHIQTAAQQTTSIQTFIPIYGVAVVGAMCSAMVGAIFSSDAWNNVTFIASEVENPKRNVGLSLLLGTLLVVIIYILCNIVYLGLLPIGDIACAPEKRVAVSAASAVMGKYGAYLIAALIMISTFGCNNGLILSGARVYQTMANDNLFFKSAAKINQHGVPHYALWMQALVASVLCLSGKYGDLLDMVSFIVVIFYILTIVGLFILRVKQPLADRPYKAFAYPWLQILYILLATVFCIGLVWAKPDFAVAGLIITLLGLPIYFVFKKRIQ